MKLKKNLNLEERSIIVLPNPNASQVLAGVNPKHWIVPWGNLLNGSIDFIHNLLLFDGFTVKIRDLLIVECVFVFLLWRSDLLLIDQ